MTREAINHVTEAENTVAQIRQDAKDQIQAIERKKEEQIYEIKGSLETDIQSFKKEARQRFEGKLENRTQENKEDVKNVAEKYAAAYSRKQDELSDYIVKEVLKRYGN